MGTAAMIRRRFSSARSYRSSLDRRNDFVAGFAEAKTIIVDMPSFVRSTLSKCLERNGTYLLAVEWNRLDDYSVGFRGSYCRAT